MSYIAVMFQKKLIHTLKGYYSHCLYTGKNYRRNQLLKKVSKTAPAIFMLIMGAFMSRGANVHNLHKLESFSGL